MVAKITLIVLLLATSVQAQYVQRVCNSRFCTMCNNIDRYNASLTRSVTVAPVVVQPKKLFGPTPYVAIPHVLTALDLTPYDTLVDIGCGDARVLIAATRRFACRGRGYEIQPAVARLARARVKAAGLSSCIEIIEGDSTKIADCDGMVVYSYMWETVTNRMAPRLRRARRVVSYLHALPPTLTVTRRAFTVDDKAAHVYVYDAEPVFASEAY